MGAITVSSVVGRDLFGDSDHTRIVNIAFSSTYVAGGDTWTPTLFELRDVTAIAPSVAKVAATTAYYVYADIANKKLMLLTSNGAAPNALLEVGNGDYHTVTAQLFVIGDVVNI